MIKKTMVRLIVLLLAVLSFCGCAVHKFQKSPELEGYGVLRFGYLIPEYTVDLNKKAPTDFKVAKERFNRRKDMVETTYIETGQIESYLRRYVTHFPIMICDFVYNTLAMPSHIIREYKYDHNEKYRQIVDERDAKEKAMEDKRRKELVDKLNEFIKQDLDKEKENNAASTK